ncbi:MAG: LysR substrate-binding domain-containing protein [Pseudomonadota bacterium]
MEKSLPPLNAVRTFEVAARHLSFVKAADELGVTQSAVSKQIATLEDLIGIKLFERTPGGLLLTLEGRELKYAVTPAMETLHESFQRFSRRAPRSSRFRLATIASFSSQFLIPRRADFEAAMPEIELELFTSDRVLDLTKEDIDLTIRYGAGGWDGLVAAPLTPGALIPVCASRHFTGDTEDLGAWIATQRRIQIFLSNEWRQWETETGTSLTNHQRPVVMEHFLVATEAVLQGIGVALLPEIIVRPHLTQGRMVQFAAPMEWSQTFYLAHLPNADRREPVRRVIDWLRSQA